MALGTRLTLEVKNTIREIIKEHEGYKPKQVHNELHIRMKQKGLDKIGDGPSWPGVSAVGKAMREIKITLDKRSPEIKGLDNPWSIDTLPEYPIPPEALPTVLRAHAYYMRSNFSRNKLEDTQEYTNFHFLSIRVALWIGRLYKLFSETSEINEILNIAHGYANYEPFYEAFPGVTNTFGKAHLDYMTLTELGFLPRSVKLAKFNLIPNAASPERKPGAKGLKNNIQGEALK